MNSTPPSQTDIANALGLARSRITAMKKDGMPTHSIEAAQRWRETRQNIARRKPMPRRTTPVPQSSALAANATALLAIASAALEAGGGIDSMVPTLRVAMAAVPHQERDFVGLPVNVINLLVAHVLAMVPPREENPLNDDGTPVWIDGSTMTDEEAQYTGEIWYEIAAGELRYDQ